MPAPILNPDLVNSDLVNPDPAFNNDPARSRDLTPPAAAGFQLWLASPAALTHFDSLMLTGMLAGSERRRFDAMRNPRRREEFAVSRALLAHVAAPLASSSLSHSRGHAALAAGPAGFAVGVDLEQHRPRDIAAIAQFAFSDEETAALLMLASPERERLFYSLWVMKEAMAKALQLSLLDALHRCVFFQQTCGWTAVVPTDRHWSIRVYQPRADFSLALACIGDHATSCDVQTREWPPQRVCHWPLIASLDSFCDRGPMDRGPTRLHENHQLVTQCCPHRDGCVTALPHPYRGLTSVNV